MNMTFKGRIALVTGAARGIGKAIAEAFARENAHVIINDVLKQEQLAPIAAGLSTFESQCLAIQADVSDSAQVKDMMAQVKKVFNRLDILVNNAGIIRRGSIETVTEDEWDQVIQVNLKGAFNCCKAAAGLMFRQDHQCLIHRRQNRRYHLRAGIWPFESRHGRIDQDAGATTGRLRHQRQWCCTPCD
jgi:3-oxoacyl-[acyl-carrier protein] reductase